MGKKKMPRSIRKFIRREKARIRREVLDLQEQEKQIKQLYENLGCEIQKPQECTKTNIK